MVSALHSRYRNTASSSTNENRRERLLSTALRLMRATTASPTSSGVPRKSAMDDKRAVAYPGVWPFFTEAGLTGRAWG